MPKPWGENGEKNLIALRLKDLRERKGLSQRALANQLQLRGVDMDKNVITRIETNKRFVSDLELRAIAAIFNVSYDYLLDGKGNGKY
ncbi:helix-turn-helix transcriptional regulator [Oscillospiraceae bacterium WX1]